MQSIAIGVGIDSRKTPPPRIARGAYADAGLPRLFRNTYRQARLLNYPNPYFSLSYTNHATYSRFPGEGTVRLDNQCNQSAWLEKDALDLLRR